MSIPLILIGNGFGAIMKLHGFGWHIPEWLSPVVTILVIGAFWWKSVRAIRAAAPACLDPGQRSGSGPGL